MIDEHEEHLAFVAVHCAVIPSLAGLILGMSAALPGLYGGVVVAGIVVKNSLTGLAADQFIRPHFVVGLRPQHHLAGHAFLVPYLGDSGAAILSHAIVLAQHIGIHSAARALPFGVPFQHLLLIFCGALAGLNLLFFNLGGLGLQFSLRRLDGFLTGLGIDHQFQNLVFVGANILFRELNLVHQRFVLLVGLHFERLVAVLGDLLLPVLDGALEGAPGRFVGLYSCLGFLQHGLGSRQPLLNRSHPLGKGGNFLFKTKNLAVGALQFDQVLYFWKHL